MRQLFQELWLWTNLESSCFNAFFASIAVLLVLAVILLSVASAKAISRRLVFLALGLILLIALNELSKLGLDLTAPKLQG